MSRSGYIDDFDDILVLGRWRGQVASAIRGERGQKLLRDLRDALDAMPVKRLIRDELETESGEYCALGVLGKARGIDMSQLDPDEPEQVGSAFDISPCMASEIVYENDEHCDNATPEERWQRMRWWVNNQIREPNKVYWQYTRLSFPMYHRVPCIVEVSDDGVTKTGTLEYAEHNEDERASLVNGCGNYSRAFKKNGVVVPPPAFWRYPDWVNKRY